ncbi:hypothetical protein GDO78_012809 [Eleutherodactylus coqui]|uniref:Uncharacterized protein n=1 Tax=Eleutherodactylus coqui TaxID=57060 RepID=A0A8J6F204_ELECQ|nr:hypothetical protein GDO78_012809 [Eleutherodactylus coqui]
MEFVNHRWVGGGEQQFMIIGYHTAHAVHPQCRPQLVEDGFMNTTIQKQVSEPSLESGISRSSKGRRLLRVTQLYKYTKSKQSGSF